MVIVVISTVIVAAIVAWLISQRRKGDGNSRTGVGGSRGRPGANKH